MTHDLERVFGELGLAQYLDAFLDQGFDTWDTILDIQESDLDALGVKLGHRRKLQRRIANARGIAPSISLSSIKQAASEDGKQGTPRRESSKSETSPDQASSGANGTNGVTKRKYRRHPKPDENAPERPPSAYVLFSNKMREDLKSQNLTFTEIAKLVGENWQSLAPAERETYESQANAAKEKYHRDLAEYKKTPEYRKYAHYLQDFKDKQAKQNQANEMAKRAKLEPARLRHGSSSSSATPNGTISSGSGSGSGSSSERHPGSEPPTRKRRVGSTASLAESHHSSSGLPPFSHRTSLEESGPSPRSLHFDSGSPRESLYRQSRRPSSWVERDAVDSNQQPLPSLSDMLEDGKRLVPSELTPGRWERRQPLPDAQPGPTAVPPLLHHKSSSYSSSGSSGVAVPGRPGGDSALPIHALLSSKAPPSQDQSRCSSNKITPLANPNQPLTVSGYGFQTGSSVFQRMNVQQSPDGDVLMTSADNGTATKGPSTDQKEGYNGMDALLRAGEIVGRNRQ